MKTAEILLQFIHSIENNPAFLYQIPWEDLELCLATELDCRRELYPPDQLQTLSQFITDSFQTIQQKLALPDTDSIVSILREFIFLLQILPDADYTDIITQRTHFLEACLQHYQNNTIIVLGDSHVNFFSGNELLTFASIGNDINVCPNTTDFPFTVLHLGPCLAYNCNRTNSSTLFHEKMEYLCTHFIKPNAHIVCCLGEIDLRAHVFRQTALQQRDYQSVVDDILAEYIRFLADLQAKGYIVSCWGPIASQQDIWPMDPEFPREASERERNLATAYFNEQLSRLCEEHRIGFLSIFDQMITADYQTKPEYLSEDHCHLSQTALRLARPLWEKHLFTGGLTQ